MPAPLDPVTVARDLIRCPSVTPAEGGALGVLERALMPLGFECRRLTFGSGDEAVENLYARVGRRQGPNFCFAGHTDVVPVGDDKGWSVPPFSGEVRQGQLWGRGAADMKGAVACFVAAASRFLAARGPEFGGAISLLITGDEEGEAVNGTKPVLDWLRDNGERLDACLVGEPTNPKALGDMVKIGRRGSLHGRLVVHGIQGHSAYPQRADNPVHRLIKMLAAVTTTPLDTGTEHFEPSNLQVTSIDVGNAASNVTPARATASLNVRFNDRYTAASVERWLRQAFDAVGGRYELALSVSGEAFLTKPGPLSAAIVKAVEAHTGRRPELSTSGGTSDARFIKDHCPVAEFGLVGETMHKVDERVPLADLTALTAIYETILGEYFAPGGG
jgi:succinyl-diaminopimelate desuccinylase